MLGGKTDRPPRFHPGARVVLANQDLAGRPEGAQPPVDRASDGTVLTARQLRDRLHGQIRAALTTIPVRHTAMRLLWTGQPGAGEPRVAQRDGAFGADGQQDPRTPTGDVSNGRPCLVRANRVRHDSSI
jgi:hypothetical protein